MKLAGKVALVTGSSQGIGQAIAIRFAQEGADVVIDYRSHPQDAEITLAGVQAAGRKGCIIQADLSQINDIQRLVDQGIAALGNIDILVNNAGLEKRADFWDVTEADYDAVMDVNLKGSFFVTQAFVRHLIATKRPGTIVNISSVHEELPFPHFTAYCASKGGIKMMTRNLAVELAPFGITINSVAPGAIATPINAKLLNDPMQLNALLANIPLKRLGTTADVAAAAVFMASADASYITGTTLFVDGGLLWNYQEQ